MRFKLVAAAGAAIGALLGSALANPVDGGYGLQKAAAPLMAQSTQFHNAVLMPIITIITLLVLVLLIWVAIKYNSKSNPKAQQFSHNTLVEVIWTGVPILILLFIAVFSFPLLFSSDVIPDGKRFGATAEGMVQPYEQVSETEYRIANNFPAHRNMVSKKHVDAWKIGADGRSKLTLGKDYKVSDLGQEFVTVSLNAPLAAGETLEIIGGRSRVGAGKFLDLFGKDESQIVSAPSLNITATGFQWGWSYSYPDEGDFDFSAVLKQKGDLEDPSLYLFEPTQRVVVPVNETVRILTTGRDVIHAWAVPAFGIKIDAVPGRFNETWFMATQLGVYYGQCSEICGKDHAFMPIAVEVVTRPEYEAWVDSQRALAGLEPKYNQNVKLARSTTDLATSDVK